MNTPDAYDGRGVPWLKVTRERNLVDTIGQVEVTRSHWDLAGQKMVECAGEGCFHCLREVPVQVRGRVLCTVEAGHQALCLLELGCAGVMQEAIKHGHRRFFIWGRGDYAPASNCLIVQDPFGGAL